MTKKIIFSGGGTGGHIFPAINLMKHFHDKQYKVLLVTDNRGNNFIKNHSKFKSYIINSGTPTNKNLLKKALSYFLILYSVIKSIIILKKEKPDLIFGFGGYVSFPISFASRFFNLPLVIYENNIVLGRANKYLSSFARKIFIAKEIVKNFPEKHIKKTYEVGTILNKEILNVEPYRENKKKKISILVLGGSQGAKIFATVIPAAVKMIKDAGYEIEVNQQCSVGQKNSIINFYNKNKIKSYIFEFDKNIFKYYSQSSIAVTRCGASTTAELVHTLTPFIAVPLPDSIDDHQYLNAKYYEIKGCCLLLEQNKFNTENLFNLIMETIKNKNKLEKIRKNMKKNYNKNVYSNIENKIEEFIKNEN